MKFLEDVWAEGMVGRPNEAVDWTAESVIYYCWMPWSNAEYVGETSQTFRHRIMAHMNKAGGAIVRSCSEPTKS